jgi:hypothetical protein
VTASAKVPWSTTTGRGLSVRHTVTTPSEPPKATKPNCLPGAAAAEEEDDEEAAAEAEADAAGPLPRPLLPEPPAAAAAAAGGA